MNLKAKRPNTLKFSWFFLRLSNCPLAQHYGHDRSSKPLFSDSDRVTDDEDDDKHNDLEQLKKDQLRQNDLLEELRVQVDRFKLPRDSENDRQEQLEYEIQYLKGKIHTLKGSRPYNSTTRNGSSGLSSKPVLNFFFN